LRDLKAIHFYLKKMNGLQIPQDTEKSKLYHDNVNLSDSLYVSNPKLQPTLNTTLHSRCKSNITTYCPLKCPANIEVAIEVAESLTNGLVKNFNDTDVDMKRSGQNICEITGLSFDTEKLPKFCHRNSSISRLLIFGQAYPLFFQTMNCLIVLMVVTLPFALAKSIRNNNQGACKDKLMTFDGE